MFTLCKAQKPPRAEIYCMVLHEYEKRQETQVMRLCWKDKTKLEVVKIVAIGDTSCREIVLQKSSS